MAIAVTAPIRQIPFGVSGEDLEKKKQHLHAVPARHHGARPHGSRPPRLAGSPAAEKPTKPARTAVAAKRAPGRAPGMQSKCTICGKLGVNARSHPDHPAYGERQKKSQRERRAVKQRLRCSYCKGEGHVRADCPKRQERERSHPRPSRALGPRVAATSPAPRAPLLTHEERIIEFTLPAMKVRLRVNAEIVEV